MTPRNTVLGAALVLMSAAGCGEGWQHGADTMGSNGSAGPMLLRNVYVAAPGGDGYEHGDNASVRLTLVNHAANDDALVAVRSSHATDVVMRWDRECDGRLEEVGQIPVLRNGTVPGADYRLELVDLNQKVRAGTSIPVTFTFRDAGETRLGVMVEATHDGDVPAVMDCR
ncbi:copper chaperone PCu(A)C [Actinophytocola algeriensis]|uniref:Copper(I)-binding protein n=1 Tax=Actinophytocola algeriensis TaxID=1768010 RepID=A0A7W7Q828_9PSEU|nr:copper chaperone PCu(A)C [Actinophytocola algeriensis]MBB4908807.1 copper(I)-binding protein [Actinophytocola algeriensis]MBE1474806.1 copper(I)-binding protein [Actinophytocola algeriensis]